MTRLREARTPGPPHPEAKARSKTDPPEPEVARPAPTDVRSLALTVLAVIASIVMLQYAQVVIIPIVLGILISHALEPLVAGLERAKVVRPLAAALVLAAVVGGGGTMLYQLRYQATEIIEQLPDAARRLRRIMEGDGRRSGPSAIEQVQKAATELERAANAAAPVQAPGNPPRVQVTDPPIRVAQYVVWGSLSLFAGAMQGVMILFLSFFLLASGDLYRRKLVKIAGPSLEKKKVTLQILRDIDYQIEQFLIVQVFTSVLVGVATWLALLWIGFEQAAFWGLLAGIFNSIPYFGPVIVTGTIGVVAFLQFGEIRPILLSSGAAFAITTLEGMLLTPYLTSRAAQMNAVAVFVGLLFWGWVWGIWGTLLAVPMLMVVKAVCDRVEDLQPVGELLGD
jgi:predicted PurR-regulated permease PerM